jgi:hypothetical protein
VKDIVLIPQSKDQVAVQLVLHGMTLKWVNFSMRKMKLWALSLRGMDW